MTATVEQIESWIVDVPTIRPHKLSMTTMGCQSLVIVRLTRSDGILRHRRSHHHRRLELWR